MADDVFRVEVGAQIGTSTERLKKEIQDILNNISAKSPPTITVALNTAQTKSQLEKSLKSIVSSLKIDLSNVSVSGTFKGNLSDLSKNFTDIEKASQAAKANTSSFYAVLSKNQLADIGNQAKSAAAQITAMGEASRALATAKYATSNTAQFPSVLRQGIAIGDQKRQIAEQAQLAKQFDYMAESSKQAKENVSSYYNVLSKQKFSDVVSQAKKVSSIISSISSAYKTLENTTEQKNASFYSKTVQSGLDSFAYQDMKNTQAAAEYFKEAEAEKAAAASSAASSIERSYKQSIQNVTTFYGHNDMSWWKDTFKGGDSAYKRAETQARQLASRFNEESEAGQRYAAQLQAIQQRYKDLPLYGKQYENAVKNLGKEAQKAGAMAETAGQKFSRMLGTRIGYTVIATGLFAIRRALRDLYQNVVELDTAMTELKKVTDETDETYARFLENAADRSQELGATLIDTVKATADFARLGYNIDQASELADAALVYKNVGDGISDINEASESVIATMQAFQLEASSAMGVVDKFNEVGNNFAISSKGVGDALLRSAAAMAAANNTLDETIALATAANTVVQDPEKVGTTLKTMSMYLRAAKTEAEEAGESTDGMAQSVSELRDELLKLTGNQVDIMIDDNTFKSSYQILKEIAGVWDQLTDVSQANILEKLGGKRNANIIAALVENFDIAENALETSLNSAGSALAENEKVLDSIAGKMSLLSAAFEEFSNDVLDSSIVKGFVDGLRSILMFFNELNDLTGGFSSNLLLVVSTIGIVNAILAAFKVQLTGAGSAFLGFIGKIKAGSLFTTISSAIKGMIAQLSAFVSSMTAAAGSTGLMSGSIGGLSLATLGWIGAAGAAVAAAYGLYKAYEKLHPSLADLQEAYKESTSEVSELTREIETNTDRIYELQTLYNTGKINLVEQEELEKLKLENSLLSAQLDLKKAQNEADRQALQIATRSAAEEFMDDTAGITVDSYGVSTDVRSEKEKIEDWIEEYQAVRQELEAAYKSGNADLAEDLENTAGELLASISDTSSPLTEYLAALDPIQDRELIDEITVLSGKIQLLVGDAKTAQTVLSSLMSSQTYSGAFDQLSDLANAGELTAENLQNLAQKDKDVESLLSVLEELGLLDWDNVSALSNQLKEVNQSAQLVEESFSSLIETASTLGEKFDLLKDAQKEFSENGVISSDTLSKIAEQFPELSESISMYLIGLKDGNELLLELSDAYQVDTDNFKKSIAAKLAASPEFFNKLSSDQKKYIDSLAEGYGVDLENYKTVESAKLQFQSIILKQLAQNSSKYNNASLDALKNAAYGLGRSLAPGDTSSERYKELQEVTKAIQVIESYNAALDSFVYDQITYNPATFFSSSSKSSDSKDTYKEFVENQIALLKHQLQMEKITKEEYYDGLEQIENRYYKNSAANAKKYAEEIRSIDEELFSGRRELFDEWLEDQEYRLENVQGSDNLEKQKDIYSEILNGILKQLDAAYKYGLTENSDYIQELKQQYHQYANDLVETINSAYDEIESYLENFNMWDSVGLSKSDWYQFRLDELKKQYDQGLMYWEEYVNKYNEIAKNLYDVQKDSIETIIDMTMDMIKQEAEDKVNALEEQIDAYSEIISKKKELLQSGQEEQDQEDAIKEKVKEIAKLQSKISQLSLDDSREAQAEKKKLEEELAQAQKELADLQGDYALDATIDSLDKQQEAFEDQKQDEIDTIQESVDSWAKLYQLAIDRIDSDWDGLYDDLMEYQLEYRDSIDGPDSLKTAWENASTAMQDYFDKYGSGSIEDVLGGLGGNTGISPEVPNSSQATSIVAQMYQNSLKALQSPGMAAALNAQNKKLAEQYKAMTGQNLVQGKDNVWRVDNESGQSVYEKYGFSDNETIMGPVSKSNPYSEGTAQYNSTGEAVKWIQYQLLKGLGYSNQTITGQYGPITLQNVKRFQSTHGLSATGTVDSKTLKYLRAYHTGGIVDGTGAINDREVLAILEKNEMVLDDKKKMNLRNLFTAIRATLSANTLQPMRNNMAQRQPGGDTFAPSIEVNIQHSGDMSDADVRDYGNRIAEITLNELREAFTKRGI